MKRLAIVPWSTGFLNDVMFDLNHPYNRDDCLLVWTRIRDCYCDYGWDVHTIDMFDELEKVDLFVFFHFDDVWYEKVKKLHLEDRTIYVAFEPPVVDVNHTPRGIHNLSRYFKIVMTWNDDLVDNKRIFKFMYPHCMEDCENTNQFHEKKLLVNISGNKFSNADNELYSERRRIIQYYKSREDFELYGPGWDKKELPSYKGIAESKEAVYSQFRFALSLENMCNIKGYVTEKILDCFCAGIVPIYLGASNIQEYIPDDCYIHYDKTCNLEQLDEYLLNVSEAEYAEYIKNIKSFLQSEARKVFLPKSFVDNFVQVVNEAEHEKFKRTGSWGIHRLQRAVTTIKSYVRQS